ncbi:hypothetical protein GGR58DRAFT_83305 [Xylaria digitata]|nr:hypothetical protein GGR58DRAFT_83305 [Xylaria digitata]
MLRTNSANEISTNKKIPTPPSADANQDHESGKDLGPGSLDAPLCTSTIKSAEYPVWYFFCCNLAQPEILKEALKLKEDPVLRPASVIGYAAYQRGKNPVLIDGHHQLGEVYGVAYEIKSKEQEDRLAFYNSHSDGVRSQHITFHNAEGNEPKRILGKVFIHRGAKWSREGERRNIEWLELQRTTRRISRRSSFS